MSGEVSLMRFNFLLETDNKENRFQASAAMLMKSVVFWVITRHRVVIIYRRFGTTYRSHPHGSRFRVGKKAYNIEAGKRSGVRMGPIRCPETSVNNYHTTPCNNPEDHRFQNQGMFMHSKPKGHEGIFHV
jgi:hypothetical protein